MRRRPTSAEHSEVVARRLEALRAELHGLQPPAGWSESAHDPEPTHTRIRGELSAAGVPRSPEAPLPAPRLDPAPPVGPPSPATVEVPVPGRHASRRPRRGLETPDWLRGASWRVTTGHVKVVAVLCAVALAGALWALTSGGGGAPGGGPVPAAAPLTTTPLASTAAAEQGAATAAASPQAGEVTVDVAGEVRRPQIVVLPVGSRVIDAIEAAGGSRRGVDLTPINLARVLVDGEQIVVGGPQVAAPPTGSGATTGSALVNINTADQTTLETLPGVGPVTASSIIAWRTDNAGFSSVDELLEVDGIGEATLADLAPLVTV